MRLLEFHGMGRDNAKKHWFMCEAIGSMKRVIYEASKITQLDTTFRDIDLTWYMKYKDTTPMRQVRSLIEIKRDLLRKFQKLKPQSQCIIEIKDIKQ
jgi:hypothetical protein